MSDMKITLSLAAKLAGVVVHSQEMLDAKKGHAFDVMAFKRDVTDPEVQAWIKSLGPLAPVPR